MPTKPAYLRIIDEITERVADGRYVPGQRLPKIADLAEEFDVSVGTMRRATDRLQDRGVLDGRQGKALFVAECPPV